MDLEIKIRQDAPDHIKKYIKKLLRKKGYPKHKIKNSPILGEYLEDESKTINGINGSYNGDYL